MRLLGAANEADPNTARYRSNEARWRLSMTSWRSIPATRDCASGVGVE